MSTIATHADCTVWKVEFDLKFDILLHFSYAWSIHSCRCWSCAASERTDRSEASSHNLTLRSHLSPSHITPHPSLSHITPHPSLSHFPCNSHLSSFSRSFHPLLLTDILHPSLHSSPLTLPHSLTHHLSPLTLTPHLALSHIIHPIHSPSTILIVQEHKVLLTILVAIMLTLNVPV